MRKDFFYCSAIWCSNMPNSAIGKLAKEAFYIKSSKFNSVIFENSKCDFTIENSVFVTFDLKNCNMMFDIPAYFASSLDSLLLCHSALPL